MSGQRLLRTAPPVAASAANCTTFLIWAVISGQRLLRTAPAVAASAAYCTTFLGCAHTHTHTCRWPAHVWHIGAAWLVALLLQAQPQSDCTSCSARMTHANHETACHCVFTKWWAMLWTECTHLHVHMRKSRQAQSTSCVLCNQVIQGLAVHTRQCMADCLLKVMTLAGLPSWCCGLNDPACAKVV